MYFKTRRASTRHYTVYVFNQRNINAADLAPSLAPRALQHMQKKKTFPLTPALQNSVELFRHIMSSHEAKAHACLDLQGPLFSIQKCDIHCSSYSIPSFFCFYFLNSQPISTNLLTDHPSCAPLLSSIYMKVILLEIHLMRTNHYHQTHRIALK